MMKKTVSAVLAVCMFCCIFCSCGKTAESGSDAPREFDIRDDEYGIYYEIYVGSFYDSNSDGCGDLAGITQKLDYLNDSDPASAESLHVDGIWLMPVMPSPSYHKYDITDYYSIDADFGTMEDFQRLSDECAARGIKLIIDMPVNHTSNQHPWFKSACASIAVEPCGQEVCSCEQLCREHNPYCEYYNFSAERGQGFQPVPGVSGWYYEAQFGNHMPELNLDSPAVREQITDICRFWLDKGLAGFRLDTVTNYYTNSMSSSGEFLGWLYEELKAYKPDVYLVGEVWSSAIEIEQYYEMSGIPSLFNFPFSSTGLIMKAVRNGSGTVLANSIVEWNQKLSALGSIDAPFLSNHDQVRSAGSLAGDILKKQAAAVYLLMPGNPFIYYGEEIAMKGGSDNDPNKRGPLVWSLSSTEGQCEPPEGTTEVREVEAGIAEQLADDASLLRFYIDVIAIRNTWPALARGEVGASSYLSDEIKPLCAYTVTFEGRTLTVIHNLSAEPVSIALEDGDSLLDGIAAGGENAVCNGNELQMPGYSTAIVGAAK